MGRIGYRYPSSGNGGEYEAVIYFWTPCLWWQCVELHGLFEERGLITLFRQSSKILSCSYELKLTRTKNANTSCLRV